MAHPKERDILRHLEMLARVKPSAESTERAMDRVREQLLSQSAMSQPSRPPRIIRILAFVVGDVLISIRNAAGEIIRKLQCDEVTDDQARTTVELLLNPTT